MTRKTSTLVAAALLVVSASSLVAQSPAAGGAPGPCARQAGARGAAPGAPQGAGRAGRAGRAGDAGVQQPGARLFAGITLDEAQCARLDSLQTAQRAQMQAMMRSGERGPAMRERRQEMMAAHRAALRAILRPEQQTVFDRNAAELRERMRAGGPGGGQRGRGGRGGSPPPTGGR